MKVRSSTSKGRHRTFYAPARGVAPSRPTLLEEEGAGRLCPSCGYRIQTDTKGGLKSHAKGGYRVNSKRNMFRCPGLDTGGTP